MKAARSRLRLFTVFFRWAPQLWCILFVGSAAIPTRIGSIRICVQIHAEIDASVQLTHAAGESRFVLVEREGLHSITRWQVHSMFACVIEWLAFVKGLQRGSWRIRSQPTWKCRIPRYRVCTLSKHGGHGYVGSMELQTFFTFNAETLLACSRSPEKYTLTR